MSIPTSEPAPEDLNGLWVMPDDLGDQSASEFAYEAIQSASFLLWALSGRKFSGISRVSERYQQTPYQPKDSTQQLITEDPVGLSSMTTPPVWTTRLRLRHKPVNSIVSIRNYYGEVIPASEYHLIEHSTIQFEGAVPDDIEVTYWYGMQPPALGRMAARTLAIEFSRLWSGDENCALPDRVTSISRQGVSYTILDNQDFIAELRTGVYAVDLFLKSVNPDNARRKSKVFSPDIPRGRRRTNPS